MSRGCGFNMLTIPNWSRLIITRIRVATHPQPRRSALGTGSCSNDSGPGTVAAETVLQV